MRLLFVSGIDSGGSTRSTLELADGLADRGHEVEVLLGRKAPSLVKRIHRRQVNLSVKWGERPGRGLLRAVERLPGGRTTAVGHRAEAATVYEVDVPENGALRRLGRRRPDVVVASSISRVSWRRLLEACRSRSIPTVLYLREASAIGHLTVSRAVPDRLVANAASYVDELADLGYPCELVPSLVRENRSGRGGDPRRALLVNPIESHGVDVAIALAAARPDIPVVLQESWRLTPTEWEELRRRVEGLANVELREFAPPPADIYRDAAVLLVPHRLDNRPRIVTEAARRGIPAVHSDWPALVEAVGPGGLALPRDATQEQWVSEVGALWDDPERRARLAGSARRHADRPEVGSDAVLDRFEAVLRELERG